MAYYGAGAVRLQAAAAAVVLALVAARARAAVPRPNLLFIMTDQQRWDTLSCSGNKSVSTPNLDRLAREGVYFEKAYSSCPVCVPARAVILTGRSIETVGIVKNEDYDYSAAAGKDTPTFDNLLARAGYYTEYWGKWHIPHKYATTYANAVRPCVPKGVADRKTETGSGAYDAFLERHGVMLGAPAPGEQIDEHGRPYRPIALDTAAGTVPMGAKKAKGAQGNRYGCLRVAPELTMTAFTAGEAVEAIERAQETGKPFSITCSMGPPHPPMLVPEPYYSRFPADKLAVPESIDDPMTDSPYRARALDPEQQRLYRRPENIRQMKQIYYGMVADTDAWVGRLLRRLDELGLAKNTLVLFTSDHGEMLGDHGMNSKMTFYEGSAHIPLILRMPGAIAAGRSVANPVSQADIFPTLLDYLGLPPSACDGRSLRNLIEGRADPMDFTISEWNGGRTVPTVMVRDARYKLITSHSPDARNCDALYDLAADPSEMHNLIGPAAKDREASLAIAEQLKTRIVQWYEKIHSPRLEGIKQHRF